MSSKAKRSWRGAPRIPLRVYRLALLALPGDFRRRWGREMYGVCARLYRDAWLREGFAAALRYLLTELRDLSRLTLAERRRSSSGNPAPKRERKKNMLDGLSQDLVRATRSLLKAPGFTLVALLTLGLGIGANTAIFSVVHGVLLKPLAFPESEDLWVLGEGQLDGSPDALSTTSPANFYTWKGSVPAFAQMAGYSTGRATLQREEGSEFLTYLGSVGSLHSLLHVAPAMGRVPGPADELPDADRVVVLSYRAWQRLFGGDRDALGKTLQLNGQARRVIGIMPAGFRFPSGAVDIYLPFRFSEEFRANRDQYFLRVLGRLDDGVVIETARAQLETVAARLRADYPLYNTDLRINARPLKEVMVEGVEARLGIAMAAVVLLLLITCANLGNLMLARGSARRREIALRAALGAGRPRVARMLLTESLTLALAGGVVGLILGVIFLKLLLTTLPWSLPRLEEIGLDPTILAFTLLVSIAAGVIFGIVPALQLSAIAPATALREARRGSTSGGWSRNGLVVADIALAMMLLVGAGLLTRSFLLMTRVDPGVRVENVLTFNTTFSEGDPQFVQSILERIESVPGVSSAAAVSQLPVTGRGVGAWFNILDRPLPEGQTPPAVPYRVVTPGYFRAAGIPLIRGRALTERDRLEASSSVVISETLADRFWPGQDPIGEEIYLGAPDNRLFPKATIVGIVGDTRDAGLNAQPYANIYVPHAVQPYWRFFSFYVRTRVDPASVAPAIRNEWEAIDKGLPIQSMRTMEDVLRDSVAPERWSTLLLLSFAGVALALAALGVFGVLSYLVTQRTREMGIRMALGASPVAVRRMVVRHGIALAVIGGVIGTLGGLWTSQLLSSLLYGIGHTDPATYAAVLAILLIIAFVASYLPARRATRLDPTVALRAE